MGMGPASMMLLALAATFVFVTGVDLPASVASRFDGSGAAIGFMKRESYIALMVALVVGLPFALTVIGRLLWLLPRRFVNVPHREYYLAPERYALTMEYLNRQLILFGWLVAAFVCFVHWLVVKANRLDPPHLANEWFVPAFVVFLAIAVAGLFAMFLRFPKP